MEELRRARRPIRREFDNLFRELDNLLQNESLQEDLINVKFKLFSDNAELLRDHDRKVVEQLVSEKATEEEEDKEFDEIREFKTRAETLRQLKEKRLPLLPMASTESVAGCSHADNKIRNFKLPTVEMKKFSGELRDWLGFWAQFQKIDEDPFMAGSDKFWYLLQSMEGGTDAFEIVSSYPQSNENYPTVIEALKKKYGNEDLLLQVYIRELLNLVIGNVNTKDKIPMKNLFLKLDSHLRALKTLKLEKADPATWLFPLVESCLPENVLYNWQRSPLSSYDGTKDDPPKTRLDLLMSFVENEVAIRQRMDITRSFAQEQTRDTKHPVISKDRKQEKRPRVPTLSSFHVGDLLKCAFCDRTNHVSKNCYKAKRMTYKEKMHILSTKGLCFRCGGQHVWRNCKEDLECQLCQGQHLTILCKDGRKRQENKEAPRKKPRLETETQTTSSAANLECTSAVALQTTLVRIVNGSKTETVRAFIDSGSQRSYVLRKTTQKLGLNPVGVERVIHSTWGGNKTRALNHRVYEVKVGSVENNFECTMRVREHDRLCGDIPRVAANSPHVVQELRDHHVELRDVGVAAVPIELLIGADMYAYLLTGKIVRLSCGAVAVHTKLGWTLMGEVDNTKDSINNLAMSVVDTSITQLWELETLGIRDPCEETADKIEQAARQKFIKNITRTEGGRYSVKLPWREESPVLSSNRAVALRRLQSATTKLLQTEMFDTYDSIFKDWKNEGFIEEVPVGNDNLRKHYVPHRPVIKLESMTTPVRPVFDASCRVGKCPSLNDCLHKGDNFVQMIPELLLRFREKRIGFVADIRKAFQMIGVDKEDRDMMRFLWWEGPDMQEVKEFRHARVMFGATCSPFILGMVLHYHLTNVPESSREFGEKLFSTFYVDNVVSSENTKEEYYLFREKAIEILKSAGMDLRLWLSNVDSFEDGKDNIVSVLGLQWDRKRDELFVKVKGVNAPEKITKRVVLSTIQKLFDPVGFTCPAVLPMKMLLQRAWINKMKWDEGLPEEETALFKKWCTEVECLEDIKLPRLVTFGVIDRNSWSIHTFTDASLCSFAAVVYLRVKSGECIYVQLLSAKSRVAPVKKITIPKLELMGCLIGARLTTSIKKALQLENVPEFYWSDSTTALAWIVRNNQWGTFVANRAKEIRILTNVDDWRHVPGRENPADLPSRGCTPSQLLRSRWWEGVWLQKEESDWPLSTEMTNENEVAAEMKIPKTNTLTFMVLDSIRNEHTFGARVRIVGWVRRFLHNRFVSHEMRRCGPLSKSELDRAEIMVIRTIQREEFPPGERDRLKGLEVLEDEWGLLRVKTRLTYRNDLNDFKYPILLPNKRAEVRQLIQDTHRNYCHAGVGYLCTILRKKYWIIKARYTIKQVISHCYRCRKFAAKSSIPEAAPLPLNRVKDAEVFEVVGVDLAGPLVLKNGKKVWMVIFTCAVYRAVHFELVGSLSTRAFIGALEKFVKKFRRPAVIYSDNGTNFRGAENLFKTLDWDAIQRSEGAKKIEWKFNPVISAWWGGWWERLIRIAKDLLKRTVGKGVLTWKELEAVIETVASVMNARPLTYISEDPEDLEPLTPALFLHPFGGVNFPESEMNEADKMRFRYNYVTTLRMELKNRFRREYLSQLINRNPKKSVRPLSEGQLVLVGADNRKRLDWPMGRVLKLIPGNDGVCRLAQVRTSGGECTRTVQRLYPLEMDKKDPYDGKVRAKGFTTRAGRTVKPPVRFG